jgi:tRNA (guanine37-N1)-methyltransferase
LLKNLYFLTTFPEIIDSYFGYSIPSRAVREKLISYKCVNLRDYTKDKHKTTDDSPFGGGAGMVMKIEPFMEAINNNNLDSSTKILLSPKGNLLTQKMVMELIENESITFLCGHYEGIDERISTFTDYKISIGDYIIGGGEIASIVITDALIRLVKDVVHNEESVIKETFANNRLDFPNYTRPYSYKDMRVPDVLISGDHKKIEHYRRKESLKWTLLLKSDLLKPEEISEEDKEIIKEISSELGTTINKLLNT